MKHTRTLSRRERIEMAENFSEHRDNWGCMRMYGTDIDEGLPGWWWIEYRGGLKPAALIEYKSVSSWYITGNIVMAYHAARGMDVGLYVAEYSIHPHDEWMWQVTKIDCKGDIKYPQPEDMYISKQSPWITDEQYLGLLHTLHQVSCCTHLPRMKEYA